MNACPDLLAALKQRLHDLELEKARAYARATEVQDLIDPLPTRDGRRGPRARMIEQPQRRQAQDRARRAAPARPWGRAPAAAQQPRRAVHPPHRTHRRARNDQRPSSLFLGGGLGGGGMLATEIKPYQHRRPND